MRQGVFLGDRAQVPEGGTESRGRRGGGAQDVGKAGQAQMRPCVGLGKGTQPEPMGGST